MSDDQKKGLTPRGVETKSDPGRYFDKGRTGLFLVVRPGGGKSWGQRIVIRGKRCELGLGRFPIVTLAAARAAALENLRTVAEGRDPILEKREARAVLTFEEAARKVHEAHAPTWRNAKHADDFINSLVTYAFPRIGARKISEINSADVLAVLSPIWTTKPETARRVRQRVGTVLKWAVAQGWRQDNPADAITKALPKVARTKQHMRALPYPEVAGCIEAVKASRAWAATKLALEFLILCASRSGEVRGATWGEVDTKAKIWTIPGERMKSGRAHRVPLSSRAIEILGEAEALRGETDLIFPSLRGKTLSDMTLSKLVKELGFDATVHGFRSAFRQWVQEKTSFPREVAEAALAHTVGDSVEQAYARSDVFEKRRRMLDAWSEYLGGAEGKIVKLGARA